MTGLYSPINRLMEQVTRPKGTGAEYMAELQKKPGYKPAEAEDRDLQTLMALPQMQRAEFMEKLKAQANKYPLKHRELTGGQTHHETYTLPGGENYREILLHTPMPEGQGFEGVRGHFGGTPNILASVMAKDRTSPEGKKILHLEEIQSDWHQQGREGGYLPKNFDQQLKEVEQWRNRLRKTSTAFMDNDDYAEHQNALEEAEAEINQLERMREEGVPHGPHAKDWHELALKAMIQHAAEKGYDQIAINHGKTLSDRYGLTQNDFDKEDMEPIANKGMVDFYDKKIPAFLNKFGKKHGVQVQPGEVETHPDRYEELSPTAVGYSQWTPEANKIRRLPVYAPVHTFDITPAMREDVLKNGIPRYAEGGDVVPFEQREANKAKFLKGSKVPERVYHGTGNLENLQSFDPTMTGKGTDQLGSGFYFSNKPETASGYATAVTQNAAPGTPKLGGNTSPGMVAAHLAIKKPIKIGPKGNNLNDSNVKLTHDQVKRIMAHAPDLHNPDESPLGNHFDLSKGVTPKMIHDVAQYYTGPQTLHMLENDMFPNNPTEYRHALHNVLGYDGVVKDFGNGEKHYVAWFPHQIKSAIGNRGTYDTSDPDITKATGGVVKEKVTISPNMDVMQYELMGIKHLKKAK